MSQTVAGAAACQGDLSAVGTTNAADVRQGQKVVKSVQGGEEGGARRSSETGNAGRSKEIEAGKAFRPAVAAARPSQSAWAGLVESLTVLAAAAVGTLEDVAAGVSHDELWGIAMNWLKGKSLLPMGLALIGASIASPDQASACSCAFSPAASIIEKADVAFEGEVIEARDLGLEKSCVNDGLSKLKSDVRAGKATEATLARDLFFSCERGSRIRVLTPLKGQPGGIVTVYTSIGCPYFFEKGEVLKVVAWYTRGHRLSTGSCSIMGVNR
jgi:hypothetical protein